jgi:hypothetical protein
MRQAVCSVPFFLLKIVDVIEPQTSLSNRNSILRTAVYLRPRSMYAMTKNDNCQPAEAYMVSQVSALILQVYSATAL